MNIEIYLIFLILSKCGCYSNTLFWRNKTYRFQLKFKISPTDSCSISRIHRHISAGKSSMCHSSWIKICKVQPVCCLNMYRHFQTSTGHGHAREDSGGAHPVLLHLQPRGWVCCSLLLWESSKYWASSAATLVCISLFKHKAFHTFSLDRIGCAALLAGCLLPACTSVQIKNLSWHTGWWYYLRSLGETAGEGKWLKP